MAFASAWLEKSAIFPPFISEAPHKDTGIIVVVPAYGEPQITDLTCSLAACSEPDCRTEVIVVVNAPENAGAEIREINRKSISDLENWRNKNHVFFRLHIIDVNPVNISGWGVGLARKTGMDEALRRFDRLERPDGVILNLDADCTVEKNYFTAVCDNLLKRKDRSACSICFEHAVSGNEFPEIFYRSIILYELHLRYYYQGLAFAGFPYVHHTVGSAIAVKALPYVRAGGMNRRMAGEDFYFIQKLVPAGGYFNLNQTAVHPSPRSSSRVPFGTGATISRLSGEGKAELLTYNFKAFKELRVLFGTIDELYKSKPEGTMKLYSTLPGGLKMFITEDEWIKRISEIQENTGSSFSFRKRFFSWFNMFRIVKYLNLSHESFFRKKAVAESAKELLTEKGIHQESDDPLFLLQYFRRLEKEY